MRILILLLLIGISYTSIGQAVNGVANIYIIGTVHSGNKNFDHKNLYTELKRLQPDIILWEQSDPFKRVTGLRTAKFLKIWNPGIEQLTLQKYKGRHKKVLVLPFDTLIPGRKEYRKALISKTVEIFNVMANATMEEQDRTLWNNYEVSAKSYYADIGNKALEQLNHDSIVNKARIIYKAEEDLIYGLVKKYCSDSSLVDWYMKEVTFWNLRNEAMARNIESFASQNPGKSIVVFTGLSHKYFLLDLLKVKDSNSFKINNYPDTLTK
jgi:hypothetical protein